ncbi:uncharacterized protein F5147DRAFT_770226 [Suillus discolor]|uniref:Uncharacterized protein n=1 Tax=Suillus discolor TaxID=1912936 RepID=A0A9P7FDG9_9AGAM|nr:uncharacterized protein F5147DRAFT_770226 [Suillus discolor]KAG2114229.1 hypothetical protein F5147DRAFT_770226 [Suillus discolor]
MAARDFKDLLQQLPHGAVNKEEEVATSPEARFHVGKSQNFPKNIPLFLQRHSGDPAVKYFLPNLQRFLLHKIKEILIRENGLLHTTAVPGAAPAFSDSSSRVFIEADRMYRHNLMCFNYTTYNASGLTDSDDSTARKQHLYLYAHVLGIYHANVTYVGPGMVDYRSYRIDFLWVRWYQYVDEHTMSLDCVCFPPMAEPDAFGFVDPNDVLRGCHIIPHFAQGQWHLDSMGISHCAKDESDWWFYYTNRFVDCDMFMQYHWGLGVGHTYSHTGHKAADTNADVGDSEDEEDEEECCDQDPSMSNSDSGSDSDESWDNDDEYDTRDYEV